MLRQAEAEAVTATAVATATVVASATATARTAEFYNWILTCILRGMLPYMLLHIAVRLLCRVNQHNMTMCICIYLTAKTDRFLMGSKKSILTPQGGLGGSRQGTATS